MRSRRLTLPASLALALAVLPAGSARAADPAGCDALTARPLSVGATSTDVLVTVPSAVGKVDLPASAFTFVRGTSSSPVTLRRPDPAAQAVELVLSGAPGSGADAAARAVGTARDLLQQIPATTAVGLASGWGPERVLVPLGGDRDAALQALAVAPTSGPDRTAAAVQLAAAQVPLVSEGHVLVITAGGSPALPPPPDGVSVQVVGAAPAACTDGLTALPSSDASVARLAGEYVVTVPATDLTGASLRLDQLGTSVTVALPAQPADLVDEPRSPLRRHLAAVVVGAAVLLLLAVAALALAAVRRRRRRPAAPVEDPAAGPALLRRPGGAHRLVPERDPEAPAAVAPDPEPTGGR